MMIEKKCDVVIIGAGLTGLTTAHYLRKVNKSFLVLEKNKRVGGVIHSVSDNGFLIEEGPNTGVIGNTVVVELFADLAERCNREVAGNNVKKRYILKNGRWEQLPGGPLGGIKTPLFTTKDKLRILGEPFRPPGIDPHENLTSFVKRRLGDSFYNYAIDPFILGVYAGDPNMLIPKYALPKLYNLEQKYGSLIGGSIRKSFDKKTDLEKKVNRKVFSFKGGLSSLTNALYESAGKENFILGALSHQVIPFENGNLVKTTDEKGNALNIKTNNVIITTGAYALESLLPFVDKDAIQNLNSLLYTKVIEVSIGFNRWEGIPLNGFGGLIPSIEKRDLLGILFMSSIFKNRAPENGALLTIFMGGVRRQDLMNLSDNEIKNIVEKECSSLMNLKHFNPDLYKMTRHEKAIPQYGVESGVRFETIMELENQYKGLFIGGNLKDGIGMADRIKQGKELALHIK